MISYSVLLRGCLTSLHTNQYLDCCEMYKRNNIIIFIIDFFADLLSLAVRCVKIQQKYSAFINSFPFLNRYYGRLMKYFHKIPKVG